MAITQAFSMDLRTQINQIVSDKYSKLNKNTWWRMVAREMPSMTAKERLVWFLDTAQIRREDDGSSTSESLVTQAQEFTNEYASSQLKIRRNDLEDVVGGIPGGAGMSQAAQWARTIGAQITYWPQKMVAKAIRANPTAYDSKAFFATDHPNNPYRSSAGTYANKITGAVLSAAGLGADAPAIHNFGSGAVDLNTAITNVARVLAYIGQLKMPNGIDPRGLTPVGIMGPQALRFRMQQLTNSKIYAQAVGSAGGTGDLEGVRNDWSLGQPIVAPELGGTFGSTAVGDGVGSDTSWYLLMSPEGEELSAFAYVNREPFKVTALTGDTDASLLTAREFLWEAQGRNTVGPGHPYQLFRIDNA